MNRRRLMTAERERRARHLAEREPGQLLIDAVMQPSPVTGVPLLTPDSLAWLRRQGLVRPTKEAPR